mgnify:FL=1
MTKALFFDIDGTLVSFQTHRVSPGLLAALHRLRETGIKLFLATGRHRKSIGPAAGVFPFDGFITVNGQYCFTRDQVLRRNPIPRAAVARQVELLEAAKAPCLFLTETDTLSVNPDPRTDIFPNQLNLPLPDPVPPRQVLEEDVYQMTAFFTREEELAAGERFFPGLEVMRWHPAFVDVIAPGGGKDRGMDAILEHFGFDRSETMAFGDGENDLPMIRHAHIGVAMGNADDFVKGQADYVTKSVDEDGIVTALEHFGLL